MYVGMGVQYKHRIHNIMWMVSRVPAKCYNIKFFCCLNACLSLFPLDQDANVNSAQGDNDTCTTPRPGSNLCEVVHEQLQGDGNLSVHLFSLSFCLPVHFAPGSCTAGALKLGTSCKLEMEAKDIRNKEIWCFHVFHFFFQSAHSSCIFY